MPTDVPWLCSHGQKHHLWSNLHEIGGREVAKRNQKRFPQSASLCETLRPFATSSRLGL
jgi:hypothetical protein